MARHIWFAQLAILAQKGRANRISRAPVETTAERNDVLSGGRHARHAHRILVRFRA